MIEIDDLAVQFGGVRPLDAMTVTFPAGICGLIGPNGAGKTTFFNVMSGFVTPVNGSVVSDGTDILAMTDFQRARWGLRRTFQTEQAIESLTVYENVLTVQEHTANGGDAKAEVERALTFARLDGVADATVRSLAAKERRFIEVARAVVGNPKVVMLDEPAAGLPDEESAELREIIQAIPEHSGATVILVDHDMELVQAVCPWTAVLDFGSILASGPTAEVLQNELVIAAYLGDEPEASGSETGGPEEGANEAGAGGGSS
jgi:branched-chain amino acid transport system ATP-binding protein